MEILPIDQIYNKIYKDVLDAISALNPTELAHDLNTSVLSFLQTDMTKYIISYIHELKSSLNSPTSSLPFDIFNSCIQSISFDPMLSLYQNNMTITNTELDDSVQQKFNDLLSETIRTVPSDENTQSKFKDILPKKLTISQIIDLIACIITVLTFVQSCSPNEQLTESNDLQYQQIQQSQHTNELLEEQNELIEQIYIDQSNKISELTDQYVDLLSYIKQNYN